jgi:DNA polymerase I-like protein with 3'-5' exonuclease and polymerase domains
MKKNPKLSTELQQALFQPPSEWTPPSEFPNLSGVPRLGIDIESHDPNLKTRGPGFIRGDARMVGVSLATDDAAWYFPFGHLGGGNLDEDNVLKFIKDVVSDPHRWYIGANLPYDLEGLRSRGIEIRGKLGDVQICEPLLDEERDDGYSLEQLSLQHLGQRKDEDLLRTAASAYSVDPKNGLWKLPAKYVGAYAEFDALASLKIWDKQIKLIREQSLEQVLDLELRLLRVIFEMRWQGIPIDLEAASKLSSFLAEEENKLKVRLHKEIGGDVNVWSGQQIAAVCDRREIKYPRTPRGAPSFEAKWLQEFSDPFIQLIAEIREVSKLKDTFVNEWIFGNHVKGRIHPQWKQLAGDEGGTRTGRMAASNPNPQQIPAAKKRNGTPNPIGKRIRELFISDTGKWCKQDYSQQEPRVLTHFAAKCEMTGAKLAAMAYQQDPKMDFYQFMVEAAGINRRMAKDMYLGRCYGMGKRKLAQKIGKTEPECEAILREFDLKVPFVKELAEKCMQLAQSRGFIKTLCGRKRHFTWYEPADSFQMRKDGHDTRPLKHKDALLKWPNKTLVRAHTHKALNALIQGSAADMMKSGLVLGYEQEKRIPYLTIHDEVGGAIVDEQDAKRWQQIMEHCVELCVPIRSDMKIGKTWV